MNRDILTDRDAFWLEHRRCGELQSDVEDDGTRVWMTCTCRVSAARRLATARRKA